MLMAFPFLVLDDIDDVWDEMKDTCPDMGDLEINSLHILKIRGSKKIVILIDRCGIYLKFIRHVRTT
jgi:hypothetical protein